MSGLTVPKEALDILTNKMKQSTGKDVTYKISDTSIPYRENVEQSQIDELVHDYRNYKNHDDVATVYLLYLNLEGGKKEHIGSTLEEYGMVLYDTPLKILTKENPSTFPEYLESTALHEFGHQLGLPHNDYSDCLMQASVEENNIARQNPKDVLIDFCNYEKNLITLIKANL
jgi:predicted Zn-dependent protease